MTTPLDNKKIAIECKALVNLNSNHLKQLQFYMHHLGIDTGFLINFPHDDEFPDTPTTTVTTTCASGYKRSTTTSTFIHGFLQGNRDTAPITLSDRVVRSKNANVTVQIVKVHRVPSASQEAHSFIAEQAKKISHDVAARTMLRTIGNTTTTFVVPLTRAGTPCKNCAKKQELCYQHK